MSTEGGQFENSVGMVGCCINAHTMDIGNSIHEWIREEDEGALQTLWGLASGACLKNVGNEVHLRGLVEFSNECMRGCTYCGIRSSNIKIPRYRMTPKEILECAAMAHALGYGTVVLQSGESEGISALWLADIIKAIKDEYPFLAVTLSVGERPLEDYRLWREKGADRYLLKFETSDPEIFRCIHPPGRRGQPDRIEILKTLRALGYEIGSGIMVGLPDQTYASLIRDIHIFMELDLDMIAIGPYVPHPDTPLGRTLMWGKTPISRQVPNTDLMTYKVIAITRILCPEANIPSTTALAAVSPTGYEFGLNAGANVIMPNLTPLKYRRYYEIYPVNDLMPCADLHRKVINSILSAGRVQGRGRGDRSHKVTTVGRIV